MISGKEVFFDKNDLIVSKTNLKGHITYANNIFIDIAGYTEDEVLGQPHNMVRHPDMPRCVFKLLWDTVGKGTEIFAYVVNITKTGDFYWVLAHVTPSFDLNGSISGYHSTRRLPNPRIIQDTIIPLYRTLCEIENRESSKKIGLQKAYDHLVGILNDEGIDYDEFVASLMLAA